MKTLDVLAKRDDEWIRMAMSFGLQVNDAREIVQEMYLKLHKYVKDIDKIMYNETEVNTFYVYTTISNLFYTGFHKTGKNWNHKKTKMIYNSNLFSNHVEFDIDSFHSFADCPECWEYYKEMVEKVRIETSTIAEGDVQQEEDEREVFESIFGDLKERVKDIVSDWYWYDAKLFRLHFPMVFDDVDRNGEPKKPMSMRKIAKETGISLKSVFLSLKAAKGKLRECLIEDYNKYKKSLEA